MPVATTALASLKLTALVSIEVSASPKQLTLETTRIVLDGQSARRDYDIVVEPYRDALRTGYRVRPRSDQNEGTIETTDGDCFRNAVVNDVVCGRLPTAIKVLLGDGGRNDRVVLRENQRESELPTTTAFGCATRGPVTEDDVTAYVKLGVGNDSFRIQQHDRSFCPLGTVISRPYGIDIREVRVYGDAGDDAIIGSPGNDTLVGGSGDDLIRSGGAPPTTSLDSGGNDTMLGQQGDDVIHGLGAAYIDGGAGFDTLSYEGVSTKVVIALAGSGPRGIEKVIGSKAGDVITGAGLAEKLFGDHGDDRLTGGQGDDTLVGGQGADTLSGGLGRDVLSGGEGADFIDARDSIADTVSCGSSGSVADEDWAEVDLSDTGYEDCETVIRFDVGAGEPGRVSAYSIQKKLGGTASIPVQCPARAGVPCSGQLTITNSAGARVADAAYFSIAIGATRTVEAQATNWPARVRVTTVESGVAGRQRSVIRLLPVKP